MRIDVAAYVLLATSVPAAAEVRSPWNFGVRYALQTETHAVFSPWLPSGGEFRRRFAPAFSLGFDYQGVEGPSHPILLGGLLPTHAVRSQLALSLTAAIHGTSRECGCGVDLRIVGGAGATHELVGSTLSLGDDDGGSELASGWRPHLYLALGAERVVDAVRLGISGFGIGVELRGTATGGEAPRSFEAVPELATKAFQIGLILNMYP